MKNPVLFTLILSLVLSGCTAPHYRIKGNRVYLYLNKPEAKKVFFASSLDGYKLHLAKQKVDSRWEITLPLENEFRYFYIADGVVLIPPCKYKEKDDFGSENCIFVPNL